MVKRKKSIIVVCYSHPELYPPTLNAISQLSVIYENVYIFGLKSTKTVWEYSSNVHLYLCGEPNQLKNMLQWNPLKKWIFYLKWAFKLRKIIRKNNIKNILIYDTFPFFALLISGVSKKKQFIWYHNHDILESRYVKPLSPMWAAQKAERYYMNHIKLFTIPSKERISFFNINQRFTQLIFLPNYPLKSFYSSFYKKNSISNTVKLIYQGAVNESHGLENIIPLLRKNVLGKKLTLSVVGEPLPAYKKQLLELALQYDVGDRIKFYGRVPYSQLPEITAQHHIGLAIFNTNNQHVAFNTAATASNKIYEYMALGLPVILKTHPHYEEVLKQYSWCFFSTLNEVDLMEVIRKIVASFDDYSYAAQKDFNAKLNYEHFFNPVKQVLINA